MRIEELKLSKEEMLEVLSAIENLLKKKLEKSQPEKWWDRFYIKEQVEKRKAALAEGSVENRLSDHIRAMIYAMLSSQTEWAKVEKLIQNQKLEEIFSGYDPDKLVSKSADELNGHLRENACGSQSRRKQLEALALNIKKLQEFEVEYGSADAFYEECLKKGKDGEHPYTYLIRKLSGSGDCKLQQMGVSLVAEYLRNLGHNFAKPDTHLVRILGESGLNVLTPGASVEKQKWEAIEVIRCYAEELGKTEEGARFGDEAYIDYLLWAFCANKYGEICTKKNPKCGECPIREYCNRGNSHK